MQRTCFSLPEYNYVSDVSGALSVTRANAQTCMMEAVNILGIARMYYQESFEAHGIGLDTFGILLLKGINLGVLWFNHYWVFFNIFQQ